MKRSLSVQLHRGWQKSGLTLNELIDRAGLQMTKVSMSRKLRGEQILTTEECEAIARALRLRVSYGSERWAA